MAADDEGRDEVDAEITERKERLGNDGTETNLGPGSGSGSNSSGANMAEEAAAPADPSR